MRALIVCKVGLFLLLLGTPVRAETDDSPIVLSVRTTGGSCLTGLLEPNRRDPVLSRNMKFVPWKQVSAISFSDDRAKAVIKMKNGESVEGRIVPPQLQITTVAGWLAVPWTKIDSVEVLTSTEIPDELIHNPVPSRPIRFDVTLRDSSCVSGVPDSSGVQIHTDFGEVELPWARLRSVTLHDDQETSTFKLWNGDVLVGCIDWMSFSLSTGLGPVHLSPVHTESIALSLGGIDLVAKPYVSATGTGHFLRDIKGKQPRRIGGRIRPESHFISAHASGRIEYEFDEPVREFQAVVTMYESYCAHKGRVIWRLETDAGEVFASRSLRNLQQQDVYVRFPPTRKLVLITDQCGSPDEDWSVWLRPEVR